MEGGCPVSMKSKRNLSLRALRPKGISPDVVSPECRCSNVPRELVLMLCLPSVDALRELGPKCICPNVVSLVQIPRVALLSPKCIEV